MAGERAETLGDLGDRQLFELAEVARKCDDARTLDYPVVSLQRGGGAHAHQVLLESALAPDIPPASCRMRSKRAVSWLAFSDGGRAAGAGASVHGARHSAD